MHAFTRQRASRHGAPGQMAGRAMHTYIPRCRLESRRAGVIRVLVAVGQSCSHRCSLRLRQQQCWRCRLCRHLQTALKCPLLYYSYTRKHDAYHCRGFTALHAAAVSLLHKVDDCRHGREREYHSLAARGAEKGGAGGSVKGMS